MERSQKPIAVWGYSWGVGGAASTKNWRFFNNLQGPSSPVRENAPLSWSRGRGGSNTAWWPSTWDSATAFRRDSVRQIRRVLSHLL